MAGACGSSEHVLDLQVRPTLAHCARFAGELVRYEDPAPARVPRDRRLMARTQRPAAAKRLLPGLRPGPIEAGSTGLGFRTGDQRDTSIS